MGRRCGSEHALMRTTARKHDHNQYHNYCHHHTLHHHHHHHPPHYASAVQQNCVYLTVAAEAEALLKEATEGIIASFPVGASHERIRQYLHGVDQSKQPNVYFYVGVHSCSGAALFEPFTCKYSGSGTIVKRLQRERFPMRTFVVSLEPSRASALDLERVLVDDEWLALESTLNSLNLAR